MSEAKIRATHEGTIDLGGPEPVRCYVLEDGSRVLIASQIQGLLHASKNRHLERMIARISNDSDALSLRPRLFKSLAGPDAIGYEADDVAKVFLAYQRAFVRGALHHKQVPIAKQAMMAIEAFVHVGLRGLIDEATGYQSVRPADDLQVHYSRIIRDTLRDWELFFDADWDRTLCRVYGYAYSGRPPRFMAKINEMVYRLAVGDDAYEELKRRNQEPKHGTNHHQWLQDNARIVLSQTIATVKGIAKVSRGPREFMEKLGIVFKGAPLQVELW